MIPAISLSGLLPPYFGASPTISAECSPYECTALEIAQSFATTPERAKLLRGLLDYRKELLALGFDGFQWVDGSFCEDVERVRGRPPGDIDVVTVTARPAAVTDDDLRLLVETRPELFRAEHAKKHFGCEAFFIDGSLPARDVWRQVTYWFGLFSHQRETYQWKGILVVPMLSNDADAESYVASLGFVS